MFSNDYAKMISTELNAKIWTPVYFKETQTGVQPEVPNHVELPNQKGIVLIGTKVNNKPICVCSGSIYYRVYRFGKEITKKSRNDESHPAANKFRRDGGDPNSIIFKYVLFSELRDIDLDYTTQIRKELVRLYETPYNE